MKMKVTLKRAVNLFTTENGIKSNAVCLLIALFSGLIAVLHAGATSLWLDDLFTLGVALQPIDKAFEILAEDAYANPPLFYVLGYIWMRLIPYGTAWVKLLCIIITFFGVCFCGINAKKLKGNNAAVLACLFAGASTFLTRNAALGFRAYALVLLLVNALIWFYMMRMDNMGKETTADIVKYGIVMALLMYTHYYGCLVAAVFFFADLYLFINKKIKWQCVFSYIGAGVVFLPWFYFTVLSIIGRSGVFTSAALNIGAIKTLLFSLFCDSAKSLHNPNLSLYISEAELYITYLSIPYDFAAAIA
jgi:uncharacterized membrane protein